MNSSQKKQNKLSLLNSINIYHYNNNQRQSICTQNIEYKSQRNHDYEKRQRNHDYEKRQKSQYISNLNLKQQQAEQKQTPQFGIQKPKHYIINNRKLSYDRKITDVNLVKNRRPHLLISKKVPQIFLKTMRKQPINFKSPKYNILQKYDKSLKSERNTIQLKLIDQKISKIHQQIDANFKRMLYSKKYSLDNGNKIIFLPKIKNII